jgi:hypothetical protein
MSFPVLSHMLVAARRVACGVWQRVSHVSARRVARGEGHCTPHVMEGSALPNTHPAQDSCQILHFCTTIIILQGALCMLLLLFDTTRSSTP